MSNLLTGLYRRKPAMVEAYQITDETVGDFENWPQWLKDASSKAPNEVGAFFFFAFSQEMKLHTSSGDIVVETGDWIVKEGKNLSACDDEIFFATYKLFTG